MGEGQVRTEQGAGSLGGSESMLRWIGIVFLLCLLGAILTFIWVVFSVASIVARLVFSAFMVGAIILVIAGILFRSRHTPR